MNIASKYPSYVRGEKEASSFTAIAVVAAGYGGDMDEELANELLDDMVFTSIK